MISALLYGGARAVRVILLERAASMWLVWLPGITICSGNESLACSRRQEGLQECRRRHARDLDRPW